MKIPGILQAFLFYIFDEQKLVEKKTWETQTSTFHQIVCVNLTSVVGLCLAFHTQAYFGLAGEIEDSLHPLIEG
jgi:hypothetical protein